MLVSVAGVMDNLLQPEIHLMLSLVSLSSIYFDFPSIMLAMKYVKTSYRLAPGGIPAVLFLNGRPDFHGRRLNHFLISMSRATFPSQ